MPEEHPASIILASASPRRRQLLTEAGYEFTVVVPEIDESAFEAVGIEAGEYAKKLALAKANSVAQTYPDRLVLGADTVVDFEGTIIGKPADAEDAERITRKLFSAPHKVITGALTAGQIAEHIRTGSWRGKAGAYAIKEAGDEFIERIEGSLTNVMGLPMERLKSLLSGL
jgi:septum formation protein